MFRRSRLAWLLVLVTVCCTAWSTTSVLARVTDSAAVGSNTFSTAADWAGCATGSSTVTASADAWIDQKEKDQNAGAGSALEIASTNGNKNRRTLVRFPLPTLPGGCSVTAATLRLYNDSPQSGRTIDVYRAGSTWAENTVTWNNQPGITGAAVGSVTTRAAGPQQWTVTAHVQALYTTNNGFVLQDRTESASGGHEQKYNSRETGSNRPQLVVTWE